MRIGVIILCTGKYIRFVPDLLEHLKKYFLRNHHVVPIILTDPDNFSKVPTGVACFDASHGEWPAPTLLRHHQTLKHEAEIRALDCEYLYSLDSDALPIAPVGDEILGDTVGCVSPQCYGKWGRGWGFDCPISAMPFETNPMSMAHVAMGEDILHYFTGAFVGGKTDLYFDMIKEVAVGIDIDIERGIMPRFHEESHQNRFFVDHPPQVVLSPEYQTPEGTVFFRKRRIIVSRSKIEDKERLRAHR